MKLLLLDLDGTVRKSKSGAKFIGEPDDQELIQGVEEAIARYSDWTIVGITNQGGVAAGHKSLEDAIAEQKYTIELCPQLSAIYFCPDFQGLDYWRVDKNGDIYCNEGQKRTSEGRRPLSCFSNTDGELISFRKPGKGMILAAMADVDVSWSAHYGHEALFVGDREEDKLAALAADVNFLWADEWRSLAAMFCKS